MYENTPDRVRNPDDLAKLALYVQTALGLSKIPTDLEEFTWMTMRTPLAKEFQRNPDFLREVFAEVGWIRSGLPVFRLTEGLSAGLLLTDPSDVRGEDWRFPFDTFLIHVPYDYWTTTPSPELFDKYQMPRQQVTPDALVMILVHTYTERGKRIVHVGAFGRSGAGVFSRWPLPHPTQTVGDWLPQVREFRQLPGAALRTPLDVEEIDSVEEIWKLVINFCLYVSDRGPGEKQIRHTTKAAKRRTREEQSEARPEVWVTGKEIKLDRETLATAKTHAEGGPRWHVAVQTVVMGHHKRVAHGPGHSLRRRQWIAPYTRGGGDHMRHLYTDED